LPSVPTNLVVEVLGLNKLALFHRDLWGLTPLHYACQIRSKTDVLSVLMCGMVAVMNSVDGKETISEFLGSKFPEVESPLLLACRNSTDFGYVHLLLHYARSYPVNLGSWIAPCTGGERWCDEDCSHVPGIYDQVGKGKHSATPLEILWSQIDPQRRRNSVTITGENDTNINNGSDGISDDDSDSSSVTEIEEVTPLDKVNFVLLSSNTSRYKECFGNYFDENDPGGATPHSMFRFVPERFMVESCITCVLFGYQCPT